MEQKTKELLIIGMPMGISLVIIGALTDYNLIYTTIAAMVGGFMGKLILKLVHKR